MQKRILFAVPQQAAFTSPINKAFRELGYEVFNFDYLKPDIVSRGLGVINNIFPWQQTTSRMYERQVNQQLLCAVSQISPQYLFVIKGETLTSGVLEKIKSQGVITINWYPDNIGSWGLIMKTARSYNYYISVCKYLTQKLNAAGRRTLYLPVADIADTSFKSTPKTYNLVFAGHKTQKRIEYFSTILDLGFTLWGYPHWQQSQLANYYKGLLSITEMKQSFRRAKIVVNVSTGEKGVLLSIANLKNFEATGVGTFVLSEYSTALAELFREDHEMVFFKSKQELRRKAIYYLRNGREREKIARAGWKRTRKDHTYKKRLMIIFNKITDDRHARKT